MHCDLQDILGHEPPAVPAQCPTELLHQCFPQHHFDVVHVRNLVRSESMTASLACGTSDAVVRSVAVGRLWVC